MLAQQAYGFDVGGRNFFYQTKANAIKLVVLCAGQLAWVG